METTRVLVILLIISFILLVLGILEKKRNDRNLKKIPIRVNVNGIRGKSTATRLITAILAEAGYRTIGKTTGTAARMIYWNKKEEKEIKRKPHGVSLGEQLSVINEAAKKGAEALVCECMAVKPEYQKVYQHQMIKANLTVIVNVLEDHLDEMGPTTEQIAWAFAETIPYKGACVIPDDEFTPYFKKVARKRHSKAYVINDSEITQEFIDSFDYKLFDHNCAVALAAARALGIPDDVAYRGMLKAHPDPGALRLTEIGRGAVFVNGFAANEPSSSLDIWEVVKTTQYSWDNPIVVMNCRPDRVDRTRQFIRDFFPYIPNCTLLIIGERTGDCVKAYNQGKYPNVKEFKCIEGRNVEPIIDYLKPIIDNRVIFGVGNIHGIGEEFIERLLNINKEEIGGKEKGKTRAGEKTKAKASVKK